MSKSVSEKSVFPEWSLSRPDIGPAVYQVTNGPEEHKHTYHSHSPWSSDGGKMLFLRYNRKNIEGEICVLDLDTGDIRIVDKTKYWLCHSAANQQWQGVRGRILYFDRDENGEKIVSIKDDGSDKKEFHQQINLTKCTSDGKWLLGHSPIVSVFPEDKITSRDDKGVMKLNLNTNELSVLVSIEQALNLHPEKEKIKDSHIYIKQVTVHSQLDIVFFVFGNDSIFSHFHEDKVKAIYSVNLDGTGLKYLGKMGHHPSWHTIKDFMIFYVEDINGIVRFGSYRNVRDACINYIPDLPNYSRSGHCSYSPDGKLILTDRYWGKEWGDENTVTTTIHICDPETGRDWKVAEFNNLVSEVAPISKNRAKGEYVIDAIKKVYDGKVRNWQTQAHPAWSRDGKYVVFNCDKTGDSQLYIIDVKTALSC